MSAAAIAVIAASLFIGALLNALVGFGFALVTVPLMAVAVGPKEAVVLSAMFGLLSNGGVAIRHRIEAVVPVLRRLFLGSLCGMPVGLAILAVVPPDALKAAIGMVVLLSVVVLARGWEIPDPPSWVDVASGSVSGVLNTSVGVSGPPIVMNLHGRRMAKGPFRATAAALFFASGAVAVVMFAVTGRIDADTIVAAAVALPAWPLGWFVGDQLHARVGDERFRGLVLVLLALTAVVTIVSVVI